jgi:hypothetical protein
MPRQVAELRPGTADDTKRAALIVTAATAGVELGDFDRQVLSWLAKWEPSTVQVVIGLITRAHAAGRAAATEANEPADRTAPPPAPAPAGGDVAAALLAEASDPCEAAAVELLAGAGLLDNPAVTRHITSPGVVAWNALHLAALDDALGDDITDRQQHLLSLACCLGGRGLLPVCLRQALWGVWEDPDTGGLILHAVRTALGGGGLR